MLTRLLQILKFEWKEEKKSFREGHGVRLFIEDLLNERRYASFLDFISGRKTKSAQAGLHASPFKGRGMEFSEVRSYVEGDDIRTIDWRVTAKTGKTHTKLFAEERERNIFIITDLRSPMFFATRGAFKSVIAGRAAAILSWAALESGNKVGGQIVGADETFRMRPSKQHQRVLKFFHKMVDFSQARPKRDKNSLASQLSILRRTFGTGGIVFILSDFHDFDEDCQKQVAAIASHADVACVYVFDPLEENPPPPGHYRISDGEKTAPLPADDKEFRQQYTELFRKKRERVEAFCLHRHMRFIPLKTTDEIALTLRQSLIYSRKKGAK